MMGLMQGQTTWKPHVILLLGLAAMVAGCATSAVTASPTEANADVEAAKNAKAVTDIQALYASWRVAVEASDIPGYVAVLHPDVRMLPPGAAPVVGANSYEAFLQPVFAAATYKIEVVQLQQVEVLGNTAVAEYEYVIHLDLKDESQGVQEPGALTAQRTQARYFDVLRKKADGSWGVWRHLWQNVAAQ